MVSDGVHRPVAAPASLGAGTRRRAPSPERRRQRRPGGRPCSRGGTRHRRRCRRHRGATGAAGARVRCTKATSMRTGIGVLRRRPQPASVSSSAQDFTTARCTNSTSQQHAKPQRVRRETSRTVSARGPDARLRSRSTRGRNASGALGSATSARGQAHNRRRSPAWRPAPTISVCSRWSRASSNSNGRPDLDPLLCFVEAADAPARRRPATRRRPTCRPACAALPASTWRHAARRSRPQCRRRPSAAVKALPFSVVAKRCRTPARAGRASGSSPRAVHPGSASSRV